MTSCRRGQRFGEAPRHAHLQRPPRLQHFGSFEAPAPLLTASASTHETCTLAGLIERGAALHLRTASAGALAYTHATVFLAASWAPRRISSPAQPTRAFNSRAVQLCRGRPLARALSHTPYILFHCTPIACTPIACAHAPSAAPGLHWAAKVLRRPRSSQRAAA